MKVTNGKHFIELCQDPYLLFLLVNNLSFRKKKEVLFKMVYDRNGTLFIKLIMVLFLAKSQSFTENVSTKSSKNISENDNKTVLEILQKIQADNSGKGWYLNFVYFSLTLCRSVEFRLQVMRKLNLVNMKINDIESHLVNLSRHRDDMQLEDCDNTQEFMNLFPLDMEKLNDVENVMLINEVTKKNLVSC